MSKVETKNYYDVLTPDDDANMPKGINLMQLPSVLIESILSFIYEKQRKRIGKEENKDLDLCSRDAQNTRTVCHLFFGIEMCPKNHQLNFRKRFYIFLDWRKFLVSDQPIIDITNQLFEQVKKLKYPTKFRNYIKRNDPDKIKVAKLFLEKNIDISPCSCFSNTLCVYIYPNQDMKIILIYTLYEQDNLTLYEQDNLYDYIYKCEANVSCDFKTNEIIIKDYVYHRHYQQDMYDEKEEDEMKRQGYVTHLDETNVKIKTKVDYDRYMYMVERLHNMFKNVEGIQIKSLIPPIKYEDSSWTPDTCDFIISMFN